MRRAPTALTFEQFRATGRTKLIADRPGIRYLGESELVIEFVTPEWDARSRQLGTFNLEISPDVWTSFDLLALEKRLYRFAMANGWCKKPGKAGCK